jgi:hypothetical protein
MDKYKFVKQNSLTTKKVQQNWRQKKWETILIDLPLEREDINNKIEFLTENKKTLANKTFILPENYFNIKVGKKGLLNLFSYNVKLKIDENREKAHFIGLDILSNFTQKNFSKRLIKEVYFFVHNGYRIEVARLLRQKISNAQRKEIGLEIQNLLQSKENLIWEVFIRQFYFSRYQYFKRDSRINLIQIRKIKVIK